MRSEQLVAALSDPDILARVETIGELEREPTTARPLLADIVTDPAAPVLARVWAIIASYQVKDDDRGLVSQALVQCLNAREAIVRRSAIEVLGQLKVDWAVPDIASRLTDDEEVPGGWFDDDSTPSQAASRALEFIGSPSAIGALAAFVKR